MELFKEILSKYVPADKLEEVDKALSEELPKQFIPKGRFNEVNDELKITKSQIEESKKSIEELTKKASSVDEYEKKLADLIEKNKEIETKASEQIKQITKRSQLKELLLTNNAHKDAIDLLVEKYSDEAEVDEKGLKASDKLLEKIKSEKGGLFLNVTSDSKDKDGNKNKDIKDDDADARRRKYMGLK